MTDKITEARRAKFEEWFLHNYQWFIDNGHLGYSLDRFEHGTFQYVQDRAHHDWRVWNAALGSVVVELS